MNFALISIKRPIYRLCLTAVALGLCLSLTASRTATTLETVMNQGVLRIISMVGPTIYFRDTQGDNGFEYLLAKQFAEQLGVRLDISVMDDLGDILNAVGGPKGRFATAGLTATKERKQFVRFSEAYTKARPTLIYRRGEHRPKTLDDVIGGRLVVIPGSSHVERLKELKAQAYPDLQWESIAEAEMLGLMQMVHDGEADYAIVDSTALTVNRDLYPRARRAFDLSSEEPLAWAFPAYADDSLLKAANRFLQSYAANGELQRLQDRFFGHADNFNVGGSQIFRKRINNRLADYESLFKTVANEYQLDWQLLAAIAYQESHWRARAKSPTGVRGLMMLTQDTAKEMAVTDRLDPEQSLRGGAAYFLKMKQRITEDITEPNRTWLALAAYNIGLGHLEDARILTERHGGDPNRWQDIRTYLPRLQQKKYYSTLRHGYARGQQAVLYVQNIRRFHSILRWHAIEKTRIAEARHNTTSNKLSLTFSPSFAPTSLPLSL